MHLFEQMRVSPPPCFLSTRDSRESKNCKQKDLNGTVTTDADKPLFKPHKRRENRRKLSGKMEEPGLQRVWSVWVAEVESKR